MDFYHLCGVLWQATSHMKITCWHYHHSAIVCEHLSKQLLCLLCQTHRQAEDEDTPGYTLGEAVQLSPQLIAAAAKLIVAFWLPPVLCYQPMLDWQDVVKKQPDMLNTHREAHAEAHMKIVHAIHRKTFPCEPYHSFRMFAWRHKYVSENCFTTYPKNRNQLISMLIAFTVIFLMRGRGHQYIRVPWVVSVTPTLIISVSISQQLF